MRPEPSDGRARAGASLLLGLVLAGCAGESPTAAGPLAAEQRPNVVLILADDLGWNQVGYHGTDFYETPNIDRLAAEGMQFSDAYSANPVCSPTRASIMTGRNPARLRLTDFIPGNPYPRARLVVPDWTRALPLEEITVAEALKPLGYATASIGKWHLSPDKDYAPGRPHDPASQGFDDVFTSVKPDEDVPDAHHAVEITDRSLEFIQEHRERPFFLYVSHHVVHRPLFEDPEWIARYEAKPGAGEEVNDPIMGAMIERMDAGIGRILDKLDELALAERTVVVFYSDNGGLRQLQSQAPLRGGKAALYEGGIRVPLAVRWPGVVEPGSRSEVPVISDDLFPTFLEIAGAAPPERAIDGHSLVALLRGGPAPERDALYFHYPHYHHLGIAPAGAIRAGDYKLIEWFEKSVAGEEGAFELFDLGEDIGERNDLSEEMPEKVEELKAKLAAWREAVGAQEMVLNPDYDPERAGERR